MLWTKKHSWQLNFLLLQSNCFLSGELTSVIKAYREGDNRLMKEERTYYLLTNGRYNFIKCYTKNELDYMLKVTNWKIVNVWKKQR